MNMWIVLALIVIGLALLNRKLVRAKPRSRPMNWAAVAADFESPGAAARQDGELDGEFGAKL